MSEWLQFHGPNAGYLMELYERYQADPDSVDAATRDFFAAWTPPGVEVRDSEHGAGLDVTRIVGAARLIRYLRELGHVAARIDPLGSDPPGDPGLELISHGVTQADLAMLPAHIIRGPVATHVRNAAEGVERLRQIYSGAIGYETDQIQNWEERNWIREAAESGRFAFDLDTDRQRELLDRLTEVETFERFLHKTFPGQKRFSIEGTDMLVPVIDAIIRNAAAGGTREVVIGMAHRGRINVLAHILGKPYSSILSEFHTPDYTKDTYLGWTGDVKYHLGARKAYRESGVSEMPITLAPNPSHLEYVNPVIVGRARAAQEKRTRPGYPEEDEKESLAILIHGDAAFPGQGIVAETLNMSRLEGYHVGGTIHIILNNQIGFTTDYQESRSTLYASDLARGFEMPVVHVNADNPEACISVARMAWAYRDKFQKDILIDLVGYRRWGHNEGDEPEFTQPRMYEKIRNHPTVREIWARELERRGVITHEEAQARVETVMQRLQQAFDTVRERQRLAASLPPTEQLPPAPLANPLRETIFAKPISAQKLLELNEALLDRPEEFIAHPKLERMLQRRRQTIHDHAGIEWAHAEALALAAILADGTPIRMTGQDSERGTFSQRHLVLHDSLTGERFVPLHHMPQARAAFALYNSPLSEAAVLAFEYGYSTHAPGTMVLWEAQFGDFANGAQVIIDQFIVAGRSKWAVDPALVLLLPHGYEGQGPEHSSARLERFLQLAATDNIRVANPTTAAQYFHLLRYQASALALHPRPLIVMTPKSLLRNPRSNSSLSDLTAGPFKPVLDLGADAPPPEDVTRLILCSGKVAIDLLASGELERAGGSVDLVRVEMLYPFPEHDLRATLERYPNLHEVIWMQEEPQNMGAWSYIGPRLQAILAPGLTFRYVGRGESASTAEGMHSLHAREQQRILREAVAGVAVSTVS
ncbi:2-oxoglutarate dehydrogenase E1 component [Candidatus Chloroploca sp. M-50]|uniref:oxoglutarate dehydrogenase (succinyl-transferring) n=1 Tax=Candidatus Chloroploca mongolica TaxID=2528176 RepID=A0ABS4D4Y0_9CHLR|nr:2-oxoglutarate dehydrogenase E1 component [Candidatus Chloroploca mongolica]MBP1464490.1 2-oxoglutarate dehydrogenase E1 component [Candidatus Chloroploca mongolica]